MQQDATGTHIGAPVVAQVVLVLVVGTIVLLNVVIVICMALIPGKPLKQMIKGKTTAMEIAGGVDKNLG